MASGDSIFGNVFGGCLSSDDIGIRHRPYHRNCTCALHKSGTDQQHQHHCSHALKVSYPVRRSFSEGCLVAMTSASPGSSPSSPAPPPPPPVVTSRLPPHAPHR